MKKRGVIDPNLLIAAGVVGAALLIGIATKIVFKMKDDNPIEEVCEKVIESQTGYDIDLTPGSKEK